MAPSAEVNSPHFPVEYPFAVDHILHVQYLAADIRHIETQDTKLSCTDGMLGTIATDLMITLRTMRCVYID